MNGKLEKWRDIFSRLLNSPPLFFMFSCLPVFLLKFRPHFGLMPPALNSVIP
jgi:hypothetical protein